MSWIVNPPILIFTPEVATGIANDCSEVSCTPVPDYGSLKRAESRYMNLNVDANAEVVVVEPI
jgi:hypothetical protein